MDKQFEEILKSKSIAPTAMRLLTLAVLKKQSVAISLTDLEIAMDKTDRVTLYRTIKTFEEHGLVHRIEDGSGIAKFALCQDDCEAGEHHDLHVHFYCTNCKETSCLPQVKIPRVKLPQHFSGTEMELVVRGICAKCSGN